jgi:hypothetical protein
MITASVNRHKSVHAGRFADADSTPAISAAPLWRRANGLLQ